jgi:hypothetical protein
VHLVAGLGDLFKPVLRFQQGQHLQKHSVPGAAPSAVGQVAKDLIEGNHAELSPAGDSPRGLAIAQKANLT